MRASQWLKLGLAVALLMTALRLVDSWVAGAAAVACGLWFVASLREKRPASPDGTPAIRPEE